MKLALNHRHARPINLFGQPRRDHSDVATGGKERRHFRRRDRPAPDDDHATPIEAQEDWQTWQCVDGLRTARLPSQQPGANRVAHNQRERVTAEPIDDGLV